VNQKIPPKTPYEAKVRVMLAGIRQESVRKRLKIFGPELDLIGAPRGEEPDIVAMALEDYKRLLDRATVQVEARTRNEERLPSELVKRLAEGDPPVKVWRRHRKLTLQELSAKTNLAVGYLSDIENRKRAGTVATLRTIAAALEVDVDSLTAWLD
jgi:hypothetical protein